MPRLVAAVLSVLGLCLAGSPAYAFDVGDPSFQGVSGKTFEVEI